MPSTIRSYSLSPTITQSSLADFIKLIFADLSATLYDDYVSGTNRILVYEKIFDAAKAFGRVYVKITISNTLAITQNLLTAHSTSTKAATNQGGTSSNTTLTVSTPIIAKSYKSQSDEFEIILLSQGTTLNIISWLRPVTLNNINENAYCSALQFSAVNSLNLQSAGLTPYGNSGNGILFVIQNFGNLTLPNHYGQRDIIPKLLITTSSSKGIYGVSSEDLAMSVSSGLSLYEKVSDWEMICTNSLNPGIFIK